MRGLLSDALLVALTTVRRRVRRRRQHRVRFVATVLVLTALWLRVFVRYVDLGPGAGGGVAGVPEELLRIARASAVDYVAVLTGVEPLAAARVAVAGLWLGWVWISALSVTGDADDLSVGLVTLQATSVRAVVLADAVASNLRRILRYGTHAVLAGLLLVLGGGSGTAAPTWLVAILGLSISASLTGSLVGLGARWWLLNGTRRWQYRHVLGAVAMGPVFVAFGPLLYPDRVLSILPTVAAVAAWFPPAWFADVLLRPVSGVASDPVRSTVAVGGAFATAPALYAATARLANRVWFTDHGDGGFYAPLLDALGESESGLDRLDAVVAPVTERPTRALIRRSYLRLLRNPGKLYLVATPLVLGVIVIFDGDPSDATMPVFLALLGAWGGGAGFALNPLSMEGPALPSLLTAAVPGRRIVRAAALTALIVTLPVTLAGVALAGFGVPRPPGVAVGSLVLTLALVPAGASLAVGVGVAMPAVVGRPDGETAYRSPDTYATLVYTLSLFLVALPGASTLAAPVGDWTPYDPVAARTLGVGVSVCLAAVATAVAHRYAARRFADLRL